MNWLGVVLNNNGTAGGCTDSIDTTDNDNDDHNKYENNEDEAKEMLQLLSSQIYIA